MATIIDAIIAIKPDAQVTVDNNSVDGITWIDENPTGITNDAILAKQIFLLKVIIGEGPPIQSLYSHLLKNLE